MVYSFTLYSIKVLSYVVEEFIAERTGSISQLEDSR